MAGGMHVAGGMHGWGPVWQGACLVVGDAWQVGMHGQWGMCGRGVHGRGHVWQEACVAVGVCVAGGCMWQGHVWQWGVYVAGGHMWYGVYVAGEMATAADGTHLLECIFVKYVF